jgi:hypothetical protein
MFMKSNRAFDDGMEEEDLTIEESKGQSPYKAVDTPPVAM